MLVRLHGLCTCHGVLPVIMRSPPHYKVRCIPAMGTARKISQGSSGAASANRVDVFVVFVVSAAAMDQMLALPLRDDTK